MSCQHLDQALGDIGSHAVVDAPTRQDDFRMVSQLLGLGGQMIGIDADAVTANQPRVEFQEVPLGTRRSQHVR
jgi:hypothetical protein